MKQIYADDDLLSLSGLQHLLYCPRQCALIHIEQQWADNFFTAKGIVMHNNAHSDVKNIRKGIITERGLFLKSYKLGLTGKSDIVEFHKSSGGKPVPFPVEYKSGKAKNDNTDKVQLCAQALCLEEMMKIPVPNGAIFYGKTKKRLNVEFDESLRNETVSLAEEFHDLIKSGITPKAEYSSKCENCSFKELCLPEIAAGEKSAKKYLRNIVLEADNEETV